MAKKKQRNLVIVESPAKARTLAGLLGPDYDVHASVGHVRDLPKTKLGVDIDDGFAPRYVVPREKQKVVRQLKAAAEGADRVFLATDPDREGEAIAWHVLQAADLERMPHQRVVFHEVTRDAVLSAFQHPREVNERLVDAQQARRILDRLVGYKISPLLWKKVRRGLSAGRVQSVALRMVVEREREITAFVPQEYWTIDAKLAKAPESVASLVARLAGLAGKRKKLEIGSAQDSEHLLELLRSARFVVASVRKKEQHQRPQPPFTTSSLQQEASRRLGFTAKRTMALAQQLYEGLSVGGTQVGLITYMRTDSMNVAQSALEETRAFIAGKYGPALVPAAPRVFRKKAKGAQEAHEAVRPTSARREPGSLKGALNRDQLRLYTLIWQRMVASQMADAVYDQTSVEIEAQPKGNNEHFLFRAARTVLRFPGYRQLYQDTADEGKEPEEKRPLPSLSEGEELRLLELLPEQHFTEPPPRFTEATLVKAMEENGIGRPSTYAPILSTIQDRGYVERDGRALKPKDLGFVVNDLLTSYFPRITGVGFTAEMEEELDEIAGGQREWQPVVHDFYEPLKAALSVAESAPRVEEKTTEVCDKCSRPMVIRWGRFGRFLACSGFPECKNSRPLASEEEAPQVTDEICPVCGKAMVLRRGRFGPFLACSDYPTCRGTRRLLAKVGVACPECGGDVVAKRTKRGRTFYGCSNYPRCHFTSWSRPLTEPCSNCGGVIVAQPGGKAKCLKCEWRGRSPSRPPAEVTTT
ncbi:MAG TPA: type I DNA topoisomerase [Dehalococcoidia bacterium]|nr:type I DNA topoisomerase [Dehalococcoidia bacterium]